MTESPHAIYDRLWAQALESFQAGVVQVDPHLQNHLNDERRGITLVARPDEPTQARIMACIDEIRAVVPDQYFYRADELHITVLSLISSTPTFDEAAVPFENYKALFARVLPQVRPFRITYECVTASPEAIMIGGTSDALNDLRDLLREELRSAGLSGTMDHRYKLVTAHSSMMRFKTVPDNLPVLINLLSAWHERSLGSFEVNFVDFMLHDWYMTREKSVRLARYLLQSE
jgi:2'-5' RNA ligase